MRRFFSVGMAALLAAMLLPLSCCKKQECLKVMSYNVRNSSASDGENAWELRRPATLAMLEAVQPDIAGLQEVLPDQEEYIASALPQYGVVGIGRNDGVEGERMSVLYNKDVLQMQEWGTWWLSQTPDVPSVGWDAKYPRTATWALMEDLRCGRQFYFVNTHLDHKGADARREGLALVVRKIREMNPDIPLVLVGDFNVEPGDPALTALEGVMTSARESAAVTEATPSFNGYKPQPIKTIDYIYYSQFSAARDFRVVTESFLDIPFISDHYPIVSTLFY